MWRSSASGPHQGTSGRDGTAGARGWGSRWRGRKGGHWPAAVCGLTAPVPGSSCCRLHSGPQRPAWWGTASLGLSPYLGAEPPAQTGLLFPRAPGRAPSPEEASPTLLGTPSSWGCAHKDPRQTPPEVPATRGETWAAGAEANLVPPAPGDRLLGVTDSRREGERQEARPRMSPQSAADLGPGQRPLLGQGHCPVLGPPLNPRTSVSPLQRPLGTLPAPSGELEQLLLKLTRPSTPLCRPPGSPPRTRVLSSHCSAHSGAPPPSA